MRIGVGLPNYGAYATAEVIRKVGKAVEDLGFDSAWTTDHVIVPTERQGPYGTTYESLSTLAFLSAITERVQIGTSILISTARNSVLVAKEAATIDNLSGGRLILGVAAGWLEEEFRIIGAEFRNRGKTLERQIQLWRRLWSEDPLRIAIDGKEVESIFRPKPAQKTIPIVLGGNSEAAVRRAARIADGWQPVGMPPDEITRRIDSIRQSLNGKKFEIYSRNPLMLREDESPYLGASGRAQFSLRGSVRSIVDGIESLRQAGVQHVVLAPVANDLADEMRMLQALSKDVLPSYR